MIILRRKVLLAGTTLQAWSKLANKGQQFSFLHLFSFYSVIASFSFTSGRLISVRFLSSMMPKKISFLIGPSSILLILRDRPSHLHTEMVISKLFLHSGDSGVPANKKSSMQCKLHATPCCCKIQASASATAQNILGADLNPNGQVVSIYTLPSHIIPSKCWSSKWTRMFLCALLTSTFANSTHFPSCNMCVMAQSIVAYCREHNSRSILS